MRKWADELCAKQNPKVPRIVHIDEGPTRDAYWDRLAAKGVTRAITIGKD
jgi:hypothetical protein